MLVLSRKLMEKIQIGENITVTVVHVKGKIVKLGIDAPRSLRVLRTELISGGEESSAGAEPAKDESTGEDDAGCHGRLARPCQRIGGMRRGAWVNRRARGGTGSVTVD